ncbi:alpha/beta hydrolase [Winogradskyella alexanderae]|uniref:Alpha/beta hydrolase n=1 Tax=Winogradskyella alexanderae TaxID=2877123 RepID=A0ABS7XW31_9FLAO|nr:alpha/beta hydrolase-fold protein [Winogradskyella alexanderae]MCA0133679.1 alpha/beta hydrolase [Winogradskyella alexanderae]
MLSTKFYSQSTASKQVTTFVIEAPQLKTEKKIWVCLPKNYKNSKNRYPVIYMHDGQNLFDNETSYVGEWKIDEYLDSLETSESIIVGIAHGNEKRIDELTPFKHEEYGGGLGDRYLEFIVNTLKPLIDLKYRTLGDVNNTTLFGSSLGGLISFYGAIEYPETFGNAIVFSPAFWINPEVYDLVKSATIPIGSRFYFLVGTAEGESMVPNQNKMVSLLLDKGIDSNNISNNIIENGEHNEQFWSEHFPKAYQWLLSNGDKN